MNAAGVYTFRIQGALHHSMGSLLPPPGERLRFAQVYLYNSAEGNYNSVMQFIPIWILRSFSY